MARRSQAECRVKVVRDDAIHRRRGRVDVRRRERRRRRTRGPCATQCHTPSVERIMSGHGLTAAGACAGGFKRDRGLPLAGHHRGARRRRRFGYRLWPPQIAPLGIDPSSRVLSPRVHNLRLTQQPGLGRRRTLNGDRARSRRRPTGRLERRRWGDAPGRQSLAKTTWWRRPGPGADDRDPTKVAGHSALGLRQLLVDDQADVAAPFLGGQRQDVFQRPVIVESETVHLPLQLRG